MSRVHGAQLTIFIVLAVVLLGGIAHANEGGGGGGGGRGAGEDDEEEILVNKTIKINQNDKEHEIIKHDLQPEDVNLITIKVSFV